MSRHLTAALTAIVLLPCAASAQETRYELGQRLRAFEVEWDRVTDATARKRTLPHLKKATASFFSAFVLGGFQEAGHGLDLARLALRSERTEPALLWAESCVVKPEKRLIGAPEVKVTLARFYSPRHPKPDGVSFRVSLRRADGLSLAGAPLAQIKDLPQSITLPLRDVKEGDHVLVSEVVLDGKVLTRSEQMLSFADNVSARLEKSEKELDTAKRTTDSLTARNLLEVVRQLAAGETLETNYPAARLLKEIEGVLASMKAEKCYYCKEKAGQFWLNVAVGRRDVPVRIQVPEKAKEGKALPLVIALHGAGGSENMFFDGYGNGLIAKLCAERGWLLVTTRNGLTEGLVDELAKLYPIDRKKVFLVGHSMGAAQAVAAVSQEPEKYAGVAALGGGGIIRPSNALKAVQFHVGIGKEDFALGGARFLKNSLDWAGIDKVVYREFKDVEHLVIVQLCLPDVFRSLDGIAKP